MTKEEYMAFSLPYNLKIKHFDANRESEHICKIEVWHNEEVTISDGEYEYDLLLNDILPILHPLSDLTKEIEHKGEKFVPIDRIKESQYHLFFRGDITSPLEGLQFSELRKLIEWHIDAADLISKGEAIDVNTLEINPYK